MNWPWRRWERMYSIFIRRRCAEQLRQRCDLMIAAIEANPTWDEKENRSAKGERIREMEESLAGAIAALSAPPGSKTVSDEADEAWENDPLFAPVRRMREEMRPPAPPHEQEVKQFMAGAVAS